MTDKESYVNVADLKRKLRAFAKYRQYSKPATDELLGVVSKLKISIKADLETTLESTDVQPVVRCKDCKHRKERHYEESGEKPYIKYECKFTKYSMSDDGFCSFGAIMDGDAEC